MNQERDDTFAEDWKPGNTGEDQPPTGSEETSGLSGSSSTDLPPAGDTFAETADTQPTAADTDPAEDDTSTQATPVSDDTQDDEATFGDSILGKSDGETATVAMTEAQLIDQIPAVQETQGRYQVLREHASGGMGRILLVHDNHIGRDVALKELLPGQLGATGSMSGAPTSEILTIPAYARFLLEAKVTGQLEHPAIVPVYELGYRANGSLYYTMKMVKGRTLHDAIGEADSLPERLDLLSHFVDLCQAISYAHSRGVVHRDIKPKNVIVGSFGETVVIDWGIAKARGTRDIHEKDLVQTFEALHGEETAGTVKTVYGTALGSPYYMPPEQAQGKIDQIDERSDVYSLGAVLYTILTGQLPFLGSSAREFLLKVLRENPKPIAEIEPDVPPELIAICERAMARRPEDRYQNATELTEEVRRFMAGSLVQSYRYSLRELLWRFVKKHKTVLTTTAIALVVLIVGGIASYIEIMRQRDRAEIERDRAVTARQAEEIAKEEAQQELYSSNIGLTERCIEERRMSQARRLLAGCPEDYRHWEWGRLQFLSNADLMTLKAGGQFVAFPANHQTLVTGTSDGTVALHDLATGEPARTFVEKEGYGYVAQLSTDGTRLAVNGDQGVTVLDVASGETLFTYDDVKPTEGAWSRAMAFSRNGSRIAARVDKGRVLIWDIGGTERATIPLERNKGFTMTFSPDGRRLLCAATVLGANGWENAFVLHDAAAGGVLSSHALPAPPFVHALVFSPDGRHVAIGTDETLSVWAVDGWEQRAELAIAVYYPGTVAFSPDGNMVAAGARDDGTLLVWDLAAGIERHRIKAHVEAIHAVRFDPTGERIATAGSDRLAKVWNASTARLLTEIRGHNGPVFSLDFNKANTRLATASYDGTTKLWAVDSALAAAQPSAMDACTKHGILAGSTGANVTIWDIRSGHVRQTIETRDAPTTHLAFSPDGGILATAPKSPEGDTYPITLWNTETAAAIGSLKAPLNTLTRLSFSPNGRHLAVRGGAKLQLWDTQTRDQLRDFDGVVDAVFSPDGAWLATGAIEDRTGRIALSNVAESVPTATFEVTSLRDLCLAFSPDSTLFLASHDDSSGDSPGAVRIWDLSTQAERATLAGHGQSVTCMSFTSDGKHLATGSNDKNIIIWNVATHEKLHTLTGHAGNIVHVGFNRDGRRLVSASLDGTFRMWDAVTGRELLTLQAAALRTQDAPSRAFFSPDERQLVVLTEPQALQPIVLHCFPASLEAYPGTADTPLQERVEAYKRQYWRVADDGA